MDAYNPLPSHGVPHLLMQRERARRRAKVGAAIIFAFCVAVVGARAFMQSAAETQELVEVRR